MATSLTDDGMRIRFDLQLPSAEISSSHWYTGRRDPSDYEACADAVRDFVVAISSSGGTNIGFLAEFTALTVYIDRWFPALPSPENGYWVVDQVFQYAISSTFTDVLPFQIAGAVSLHTNDTELPIRRRRNRSYLGPVVPSAMLASSGRMNTTVRDGVVEKVVDLNADLFGIPVPGSTPDQYGGLCIVSYKGTGSSFVSQITRAETVRMGDVLDTQRRRRSALVEAYEVETLPDLS